MNYEKIYLAFFSFASTWGIHLRMLNAKVELY